MTLLILLAIAGASIGMCVACGDALDDDPAPDADPSDAPAAPADAAGGPDAPPDADPFACLRDGCCETCCRPDNLGSANCCQEPPELEDPSIILDVTTCTWWDGWADAGVSP